MCLAIPAKIVEVKDGCDAVVDILGVTREISTDLTPQAKQGDFVLVHAGFSIEVVDEQYAQETIDLIRQFPELAGQDIPEPAGKEAPEPAGHGNRRQEDEKNPLHDNKEDSDVRPA